MTPRLLILAALLASCRATPYRQPEGWPWEREGGYFNVFYHLRP